MRDPAPIYNITPFTLMDYPDKVACIVWLAGCNMRCLYCYNPHIVLGKGSINFEKVLEFLNSRKGILEAVVLSGGECTMHSTMERHCLPQAQYESRFQVNTTDSNHHK